MNYPYFYQIQKRHPLTHLRPWSPAYEIEEDEGHYLLSLELAGVPKDQIKLEVHEDQLVISGERRLEKFQRVFAIPAGVDADQVEANYQDGMLRVYLPKAESAKPRQIKITNGFSEASPEKIA